MNDAAVSEVAAARQHDYMLHIRLYCEHSDCPAREIKVVVKDYDDALRKMIRGAKCPLCGGTDVSLHYARTRAEQLRAAQHAARESIVEQMIVRDLRAAGYGGKGLYSTTASLTDDRGLPPTPEGWWVIRRLPGSDCWDISPGPARGGWK